MIWYTDRLKQPLWNLTASFLSVSRERDPSLPACKCQVGQVQNSLTAGSQSPVSQQGVRVQSHRSSQLSSVLRVVCRILHCWQVIDEDASILWAAMRLKHLLPSIHLEAIRLRLYVLTLTVSVQIKQLFIQHKVLQYFIDLIVWCNHNIHLKQQQLL